MNQNNRNEDRTGLISRKSTSRFLLRMLIGILLLVLIAALVDVHDIVQAYSEANFLWMALGLLLAFPNLSLQAAKWKYLLSIIRPHTRWPDAFRSLLFGITLGSFTPGQIGELGGRALTLDVDRPGVVVGLTSLDKFQMLIVLMIGGTWSTAYFLEVRPVPALVLTAALSVLGLLLFFVPQVVRRLLELIGVGRLRNRVLNEMLEAFSILNRRQLAVAFFLTLATYALLFVQFYLLFLSFVPVTALDVYLGFSALMFYKALIPISIGDLGIREAGSVYFFTLLGISGAAAFNAAILLSAFNILLPAVAGTFFIPQRNVFRKTPQSSEGDPSE